MTFDAEWGMDVTAIPNVDASAGDDHDDRDHRRIDIATRQRS